MRELNSAKIRSSDITPEPVYLQRRSFLHRAAALGASLFSAEAGARCEPARAILAPDDKLNSFAEITHHNNFYEYSPDKRAPATLAQNLAPRPWSIRVEGEVEHARTVDVDELIRENGEEERIYRLRCIEGWSMVIPWNGFPLCKLLERAQPTSRAKFVEFIALHDPARFYGQRRPTLPWPYTEGLTISEAMHPLTILATGLYGKPLPNQNGAPVRLVVPWKYGFKSIKSIVTLRLRETRPLTTWPQAAPKDYGFYGNVNPRVAGTRGTQSRETRIGELRKRETLLFNGYAAEVGHLYAGLDVDSLL
jgi:sulfoxide reductase catalytic subunit YedY